MLLMFGPLPIRILAGITFIAHGLPKFEDVTGTQGFFGNIRLPPELALTYYLRSRSEMKRFAGRGGIRDLFGPFSSAFNDQYRPLKYYCMSCGKEHREIACPNCGSKMKRIG
jgi:hypothetical protein